MSRIDEWIGNTYGLSKIFFENPPIKKPTEAEAALFEQLVALVQLAKRVGQASRLPFSESKRDACAIFFEELTDICILEVQHHAAIKQGNCA